MKPCCQACGFPVYNRRYPKCESCGVVLAAGLAMTTQERAAAFEADRAAAEQDARERKMNEADAWSPGGVGTVGDCGSADGGGCGGGDGGGGGCG